MERLSQTACTGSSARRRRSRSSIATTATSTSPACSLSPSASRRPGASSAPRREQLHAGIEFHLAEVDRVETAASAVHLGDGSTLTYDVLVIASGASLLFDETEGLRGPGWGESVFSFYSLEDAVALRKALGSFERGRLVVNLIDMPIKCPVAPLEFCFLADWFLRERGRALRGRDHLRHPPRRRLHQAGCSRASRRDAGGEGDRAGERVLDRASRRRRRPPDQLGSTGRSPLTCWSASRCTAVRPSSTRSEGLGDELGFIPTDRHTLQSKAAPNVFAIGDAASLPTSKAGSATHFEGETLTETSSAFSTAPSSRVVTTATPTASSRPASSKALLIDFNYETEPLPGRFPQAHLGPLSLLSESRLNHLGKLAFQCLYWHVLLPGREIPGISSQMPMAGKQAPATAEERTDEHDHLRPAPRSSVDAEGFLQQPAQWNEEIAREIASEDGIEQLTDRHWLVINFMRDTLPE